MFEDLFGCDILFGVLGAYTRCNITRGLTVSSVLDIHDFQRFDWEIIGILAELITHIQKPVLVFRFFAIREVFWIINFGGAFRASRGKAASLLDSYLDNNVA
jgi:hypothetical protein